MARILITSGPTRQYLDPVRYLSNGSSGRMGAALARAAIELGHQALVVTGPVTVDYPAAAEVIEVVTTDDLLRVCAEQFPRCEGLIGAAAPCDYRPVRVAEQKLSKTGQPLTLHLIETPDVVATMGAVKRPDQWVVGFALETEDQHFRAITKMERKSCDLMVLNGPEAMNAAVNRVEILDRGGAVVRAVAGSKEQVAQAILETIQERLVRRA